MRISNKLHKGAAIAAAVVGILILLYNFGGSVRSMLANLQEAGLPTIVLTLLPQVFELIAAAFCVIVLFLGKKDKIPGALMLIIVLFQLVNVGAAAINLVVRVSHGLPHGDMVGPMLVNPLARVIQYLFAAVFYGLIALECFKPGKVSGSMMKYLLIVFPVIVALFAFISTTALFGTALRHDFAAAAGMIFSLLFNTVVDLAPVLMTGIAFGIPVYEQPAMYYPNNNLYV